MKVTFKSLVAALLALVLSVSLLAPAAVAADATDPFAALTGEVPGMPDLSKAVNAGDFTYVPNADGTASIVGYNGKALAIRIPDTLDGKKVTAVDSLWLTMLADLFGQMGLTQLENFELPAVMLATSVSIPSSVVRINTELAPFAVCSANVAFTVDAANPNYKAVDGVLYNKAGTTLLAYPTARPAKSFSVPKTVKTIGVGAFLSNLSLQSVKLPTGLATISMDAFGYAMGLRSISIPKTVKTIGAGAFESCASLKTVKIASGVKAIRTGAFRDCTALKKITVPKSVTSIAADAFSGSPKVVVTCYTGSKAHKVAKKNKVAFDLVDLTGLKTVKKKTYFYKKGKKAKNQWCKLGKKTYRTDKKGVILKNKWVKRSGKWYYLDKKGVRVTGKKATVKGKTYRFNKKGVCLNK